MIRLDLTKQFFGGYMKPVPQGSSHYRQTVLVPDWRVHCIRSALQCIVGEQVNMSSLKLECLDGSCLAAGAPVVLHKSGLVSDGRQVHLGFADVWHGNELPDDVVSHLSHETKRLAVVAPRGEDLIQPGQVLLQTHLHAFQRASHLGGTQTRSHNPMTINQFCESVLCRD